MTTILLQFAAVALLSDRRWELDGALPLHKLAEILDEPIEEAPQVSTLSGWVMQKLGRFPCAGDEIRISDWILRVEALNGTKVAKFTLRGRPEGASKAV
jgi:CBS domain containing-hemolysin-like protein